MKIKNFILVPFLIFMLLILTGCGVQTEPGDINDKIKEEINYLDSKIISLLNSINGINLQNYKVETKKITMPETQPQQGESSSSSENEGGESSGKEEQSQNGESKQSSNSDEEIILSEMKTTSILVSRNNEPDWFKIKSEVELLFSVWDTIIPDLYKVNVPTENVMGFSNVLNEVTINIKNENIMESLNFLTQLYSYLPHYLEYGASDGEDVNIKSVKMHILNAYNAVEKNDWDAIQVEVESAIDSFSPVLNNYEYIKGKEHSINRIYIILNELKNSLNKQDKDIFYINYKNVINELNIL